MVEIVVVLVVFVFQIFVRVDIVGEVIFHPGVVLLDAVDVVDVNVCSLDNVVSNVVVHHGGHVLLGVGVVYTVVVESVGVEEVVVKLDVELQFVQGKSRPYCGDGKPEEKIEKITEEIEVYSFKNNSFSNNLK